MTSPQSKRRKVDASVEYARQRDRDDQVSSLRDEFTIPSKAELKSRSINSSERDAECTYLCGNSLGLPPKRTSKYVNTQLSLWGSKGVYGHFKQVDDSIVPPWVDMDETAVPEMSKIVGARESEVAVMQTLSANLHLLLLSFFEPTKDRYKIILEGKAFPSDHYIVESQLRQHRLDPADAMVLIEPPSKDSPLLSTSHILSVIDKHASTTAVLLLPGIQFYTGQFFDIKTITAHAQSKGIIVGWDCAHAVGNVPLHLHDWNVDFAAWCNYKYMNCGPGAIGGIFVHDRHTQVESDESAGTTNGTVLSTNKDDGKLRYRHRLAGWWGSSKTSRFTMTNEFEPIPGAAGYQLSNPSALDISAVLASLAVFGETSMSQLRERSLRLTGYLEELLDAAAETFEEDIPWTIITSRNPEERGAQLSVRLRAGILDQVMAHLEEEGVVIDERKPDVVRIAPAPLYNTYEDIWKVVNELTKACRNARKGDAFDVVNGGSNVMVEGGRDRKGASEIK